MARSLPILAFTCLLLAGCDQEARMERAMRDAEVRVNRDINGKVEELNTKIEKRSEQVQNQLQGIGASIGQMRVEVKAEIENRLQVELKARLDFQAKVQADFEAKFEKLTAQVTSQIQAGFNNTSNASTQTSNAGRDSTISHIVNFTKEQLEAAKSENRTTVYLVLGLTLILSFFQERSRRRADERWRTERGIAAKGASNGSA